MKARWSALLLLFLGSGVMAQGPLPYQGPATVPAELTIAPEVTFGEDCSPPHDSGFLTGNHNFRNFIDFVSNPLQNIDPRAVTAIYPLFGSSWPSVNAPLPSGDIQLYGPALTIALSDRLAVGLNQGGYAVAHFSTKDQAALLAQEAGTQFQGQNFGGNRSGFLNIGGFVQYTLIEDVADQFLLTGGLRWVAPCGSHEVFQGHGPVTLAPYVTVGKEFCKVHVLATCGYQFQAGPSNSDVQLFYGNVHLDRQTFGWLYPLVEVNTTYHTRSVSFGLPTQEGFIDFGNFESSGNLVALAAGANAVLVPERLEIGAVYTTSLATQKNFSFDGLLVKMVLRY